MERKILFSVHCCKAGRAPALLSLRFLEEDIGKCIDSFSEDAGFKIRIGDGVKTVTEIKVSVKGEMAFL